MPLRIIVLFWLLLAHPESLLSQLQPIGQWRDHLPYHQAIQVTHAGGKIWCATPYSLFSVEDADNTLERHSKINGLSETGISAIGANETSNQLIIAYYNSQVDILQNEDIYTIDAIKNSTVSGDKTIHHIYTYQQQAYLSTGIGIIVVNLEKKEVKDTYIIGSTGNKINVNATATDGQFLYAATGEGLKKAPVNSNNLSDFRNWQNISGTNGLTTGSIASVAALQQNIIVLKNDSLFSTTGTNWSFLYAGGWTINNITISDNKILVSETNNNTGRITVLSTQGNIVQLIQHPQFTKSPRQAISLSGNYWIADTLTGLSRFSGNNFEPFVPNSPYAIATGTMQVVNNTLWATAGITNANWEPQNNKDGLYRYADNTWVNFTAPAFPAMDTMPDMISLAIDLVNQSAWAGSLGGGMINIKPDNTIQAYKQNSPLQSAYFAPGSYRVSGLAFDLENNLWIANYGANQNIAVRKADGTWRSFFIPYSVPENAVSQIVIDDQNQQWIIAPKGNGLFCFNHGQTIDNPGDDRWKWYKAGKGNGNLPDNNVLSVAKDKSGFIWVGTMQGIGIVQCAQEVFTSTGCEAVLPVVQQDNFAGYLFSDEQVQAIAVDGADRKWIGTKNGVWLISPDGEKTIIRFTAENSPLVSNDVKQIAIDGNTGEVFFATAKGICSFRGTATEGSTANSNVLVFPNPVPPGYAGTIAIRGVANNAIVKIAELDGRLVYQTRALGGQAVWNGKDYKGRTISTGIYLVLVSDDNKQEKTVSKIVFIKK